jgi:glutaredoxin
MTSRSTVVIYSRPGCHLCDEAKHAIAAADLADRYTLQEINIDTDPALIEKYCYDIPVITIDGVEAFRHRLTTEEFRKALQE